MPIFRLNGEVGKFSSKIRCIGTFAESGKFSNLEKSENFLPKSDQLEYFQVRKIFRQIGKFSTFPSFSKILFRPIGEGGNFSNEIRLIGIFAEGEEFPINRKFFHFTNFLTKVGVKKSGGKKKVGVKKWW